MADHVDPPFEPVNMLPLDQIIWNGGNIRSDLPDIESLVNSIKVHGLLQPLLVSPGDDGTYHIVDGRRRLAALRQVHEGNPDFRVPALIKSVEHATETALVANVERVPMHPFDEAAAYAEIAQDPSMSVNKIATRFGVTAHRVKQRMALTRLHTEFRDLYDAGLITLKACQRSTDLPVDAQKEVIAFAGERDDEDPVDHHELDAIVNNETMKLTYALFAPPEGLVQETLFGDADADAHISRKDFWEHQNAAIRAKIADLEAKGCTVVVHGSTDFPDHKTSTVPGWLMAKDAGRKIKGTLAVISVNAFSGHVDIAHKVMPDVDTSEAPKALTAEEREEREEQEAEAKKKRQEELKEARRVAGTTLSDAAHQSIATGLTERLRVVIAESCAVEEEKPGIAHARPALDLLLANLVSKLNWSLPRGVPLVTDVPLVTEELSSAKASKGIEEIVDVFHSLVAYEAFDRVFEAIRDLNDNQIVALLGVVTADSFSPLYCDKKYALSEAHERLALIREAFTIKAIKVQPTQDELEGMDKETIAELTNTILDKAFKSRKDNLKALGEHIGQLEHVPDCCRI